MTIRGTAGHEALGIRGRFLSILLLALSLVVVLSLAACAQEEAREIVVSDNEYAQTKIDIPEELYTIEAMGEANNGHLWMISTGYYSDQVRGSSLWELNEDNSWEEPVSFNELLELDENDYICASAISKSSTVLCLVFNWDDYASGMRFYLVDSELEKGYRELNIDTAEFVRDTDSRVSLENLVYRICPLKDDRFFIYNITPYGNNISSYILDVTNETIKRIPHEEGSIWLSFLGAAEIGETLYVLYDDSTDGRVTKLSTLDISMGTLGDVNNEELTSIVEKYGTVQPQRVIPTIESDQYSSVEKLTICLRSGFIEYSDNKASKIVKSEGTVMSDTDKDILGHTFVNEDNFFLLTQELTNPDGTWFLYKYEKTVA